MRVGRLERVQPTFLLIETPKRAHTACLGTHVSKHTGGDLGVGRVEAGRGKTLEG
jgi:hypothetical protein